jgi:peroxiredoxin
MPQLQRLYEDLKDNEDFQLLTISIDALGAQVVKPYMEKYKLDFPALLDPKGSIKTIYNTTGVPESFIINQKGMIVDKIIGPRDWSNSRVKRFFESLIEKG